MLVLMEKDMFLSLNGLRPGFLSRPRGCFPRFQFPYRRLPHSLERIPLPPTTAATSQACSPVTPPKSDVTRQDWPLASAALHFSIGSRLSEPECQLLPAMR